jgi:hypothetical protein
MSCHRYQRLFRDRSPSIIAKRLRGGGLHPALESRRSGVPCALAEPCRQSLSKAARPKEGSDEDNVAERVVAMDNHIEAQVDVRGTLLVDKTVPVGFQQVSIAVQVDAPDVVSACQVESLINAAEYSCSVLQTIRSILSFNLFFVSNR